MNIVKAHVYLIPTTLHETAIHTLPSYLTNIIQQCEVWFVENERSARRFLKQLWPAINIDTYKWYTIHKAETEVAKAFQQHIKEGKHIGILSEAGCPAIADPGQQLVALAQEAGAIIHPLVGPSSILLALMASGMNGQQFQFHGYLPIDNMERKKKLKELEQDSIKRHYTQIFIETPYRNNALLKDIITTCNPKTKLCIAAALTSVTESIQTKTITAWKNSLPDIHKIPSIFLISI